MSCYLCVARRCSGGVVVVLVNPGQRSQVVQREGDDLVRVERERGAAARPAPLLRDCSRLPGSGGGLWRDFSVVRGLGDVVGAGDAVVPAPTTQLVTSSVLTTVGEEGGLRTAGSFSRPRGGELHRPAPGRAFSHSRSRANSRETGSTEFRLAGQTVFWFKE